MTNTTDWMQDTDSDMVTCVCGNAAHLDGFYPCNAEGVAIPDFSSNDPAYWSHTVCVACGRVAPSASGKVATVTAVNPDGLIEPA